MFLTLFLAAVGEKDFSFLKSVPYKKVWFKKSEKNMYSLQNVSANNWL
jgi:hypothetical protein